MPTDENVRARAGEQEVNNAHQGRNDAQQGRNDAQMDSSGKEQARTNKDQGVTNAAQGVTNAAQGVTNTAQDVTNVAQDVTNVAQDVTNACQEDINSGVQDSIDEMRKDVSLASVDNETILKTVRALAKSLDANTQSLKEVSEALDENQKYTENVEKKGDSQAITFKRMGALILIMVVLVGLGGFGLNAYSTHKLCAQRNTSNVARTDLLERSVEELKTNDPSNVNLPALELFLDRSVQVDCTGYF